MKKIMNNKLIMFILIMFYFKPICFQYYSNLKIIEKTFVYGKIAVATFVLLFTIINTVKKKKVRIDRLLVTMSIFELITLIITICNNGYINRIFIDFVTMVTFILLLNKLYKINKIKLINTFKILFFVCMLLQLASELIYPSGMNADLYENNKFNPLFFMTLDNGITDLICLSIVIIELALELYKEKKSNFKYIYFLLCVVTAIFSGSTTAVICTVVLIFGCYIIRIKELKLFEYKWLWILLYIVLLVNIINPNGVISNIFFNLTGKQGFTGRTFLWKKALEQIKYSPLFGYGIQEKGYLSVWGGYYSSHNVVLEILLQSGALGLFAWGIMLLTGITNIKFVKLKYIRRLFVISIFIILCSLLMESVTQSIYLCLLLILINLIGQDSELGEKNGRFNKCSDTDLQCKELFSKMC